MYRRLHANSPFIICVFLSLAVGSTFWSAATYDFVKYDDDKYVTDNRHVQSGLNPSSIKWAFTTGHASNWHPLTWLSHMLDCQLFGLNAGAHHLTNVLLHIASTVLLFIVLKAMTGALWPSAFVAALFGLHPLHVESVAWIAERKDVLSALFWMLTMLAYTHYARVSSARRYLLALLLFVLGLMAKPMLVTLPFVLLLLDYWPLQRIKLQNSPNDTNEQNTIANGMFLQKKKVYLFIEKLPFLVFSFASSIVTFLVQQSSGAVSTFENIDIRSRLSNTIVSYVSYIEKMAWPSRLAVLYPHARNTIPVEKLWVCALVLVLLSILFIYFGRHYKYLIVGWLWYLGTLVPVIGLVQVGAQAMADRYTYIPLIGLFIIVTWGAVTISKKLPFKKSVLSTLSVVILVCLMTLTSLQLRHWKNSITLFEHTLDVTKNNYIVHNNYANLLNNMGKTELAISHFSKSLRLRPNSAEIHNNIGNALRKIGQVPEAIQHYQKAIALKHNFAEAHYNLALALSKLGNNDEAVLEYQKALSIEPNDHDTLSNLGFLIAQKKDYAQAIKYYQKALAVEPSDIITHGRLGLAFAELGEINQAIEQFKIVLQAKPNDFEMHCNLGLLLKGKGNSTEAISHFKAALEINPDYSKAKNLLQATQSNSKTP